MRGMRRTIASRMHESLHDMAQLTLTMDAAMDRVVADRRRRQADGAAPSYTDYVIAAVAAVTTTVVMIAGSEPAHACLLPGIPC